MKKLRLLTALFAFFSILSLTACEKTSTQQQYELERLRQQNLELQQKLSEQQDKQHQEYAKAIQSIFKRAKQTLTTGENISVENDINLWYQTWKSRIADANKFDLSQCPTDFQDAYLNYIRQLEETVEYTKELGSKMYEKLAWDLAYSISEFFGYSNKGAQNIIKAQKTIDELHKTQLELRKAGLRYGVDVRL